MPLPQSSRWVQTYRGRILKRGTYSLENWVAVMAMHEKMNNRIVFWLEPRENLRDVEGLMDLIYDKYGMALKGRPPIGLGALNACHLRFDRWHNDPKLVAPIVQQAFLSLYDEQELSDFQAASISIRTTSEWGTIGHMREKENVDVSMIQSLYGSTVASRSRNAAEMLVP